MKFRPVLRDPAGDIRRQQSIQRSTHDVVWTWCDWGCDTYAARPGHHAARNTNMHWNAVMEGVIRISHLIELVYSQKIPKKLVKKILWYYLVTIPNYV